MISNWVLKSNADVGTIEVYYTNYYLNGVVAQTDKKHSTSVLNSDLFYGFCFDGKSAALFDYVIGTGAFYLDNTTVFQVYTLQSDGSWMSDGSGTGNFMTALHSTDSSTNIPMFSSKEAMITYCQTGDDSGQINKPRTPIDWKVYFNGNKSPSIKITWTSNGEIEKLKNSYVNVMCTDADGFLSGDYKQFAKVPFTNGNYSTTYNALMTKNDPDWYDQILGSLFPDTGGTQVVLILNVVFGDDTTSSKVMTVGGYDGTVDSYGLVSETDDDGSTIEVIYGTGENDEGYVIPNENSDTAEDINTTDVEGYSANGILTTTFAITESQLQSLGGFIWSNNFIENIKLLNNSPIENILSIKLMPINLASSTTTSILLGNVDTGIYATKVTSKIIKVNVGSIDINELYNSFLDYAPFTKITIFLPFIGFMELDCNEFMGRTLKVTYYFDIITGNCQADISANDYTLCVFDGQCGIDIPITASNRAQVESAYIKGIINTGAEIIANNPTGAINAIVNSATAQYHYQTSGSLSPSCSAQNVKNCYVIIDRPTYQDIATFRKTKGLMCNLSYNIGSLSGFTKCNEGVNLSGIPCTETERQEIHDILTNGFFA